MALKVFSIHLTSTRSKRKKDKGVFFLDNDSEIILEQSKLAVEQVRLNQTQNLFWN